MVVQLLLVIAVALVFGKDAAVALTAALVVIGLALGALVAYKERPVRAAQGGGALTRWVVALGLIGCAAMALSGCTNSYGAPAGYSEAEIGACKSDVALGRTALVPLMMLPVVGSLVSSTLPTTNDAVDRCLAERRSAP